MLSKLLVANRGEIALRIIRTAMELGIPTVALYAQGEEGSLWAKSADEAVGLPGRTARETYLSIPAILEACRKSGADTVHPGYGFLAENAAFARAVSQEGMTWVGPSAEVIEIMGDKLSARKAAQLAGVQGVPGTVNIVTTPEAVTDFGQQFGWPVAIKAAYGGGGRGMRVVQGPQESEAALESARREAVASFGNGDCYLEKYITKPRHVEIQIIADQHGNALWLGDRDCTTQRRHQKLIEECPAPEIPAPVRQAMGEAAVAVAQSCGYVNAGTVEFLYSQGEFYFLEMNTRLQVEHPVTEAVYGVDLVAMQLAVAAEVPLAVTQEDLMPKGHAIECRINAEDPSSGRFSPSPGRIAAFERSDGPGIRTDAGYAAGDEVSQHFDNLICKVIAWGQDREHARRRMLRALRETSVQGVPTTLAAQTVIINHPDFIESTHFTTWVQEHLDLSEIAPFIPQAQDGDGKSWTEIRAEVDGKPYSVRLLMPDAESTSMPTPRAGRAKSNTKRRQVESGNDGSVTVPMQGTIVKVLVSKGQKVEDGDTLCILEAMKMENAITATCTGTVTELHVAPGDAVATGDLVAMITATA